MCKFKFTPILLQQEGDIFCIELDMFFICDSAGKDRLLMFTPVLTDKDHRLELPMVLVAGKSRYRALRRILWNLRGLGKNILRHYRIHKILKAADRQLTSYRYRVRIDYEDWMGGAAISLC